MRGASEGTAKHVTICYTTMRGMDRTEGMEKEREERQEQEGREERGKKQSGSRRVEIRKWREQARRCGRREKRDQSESGKSGENETV